MKLLDKIKIYLVFYILLLESADPKILVFIRNLTKLILKNKYKIKKIVDDNSKI